MKQITIKDTATYEFEDKYIPKAIVHCKFNKTGKPLDYVLKNMIKTEIAGY